MCLQYQTLSDNIYANVNKCASGVAVFHCLRTHLHVCYIRRFLSIFKRLLDIVRHLQNIVEHFLRCLQIIVKHLICLDIARPLSDHNQTSSELCQTFSDVIGTLLLRHFQKFVRHFQSWHCQMSSEHCQTSSEHYQTSSEHYQTSSEHYQKDLGHISPGIKI